jgi:hypothetical protein
VRVPLDKDKVKDAPRIDPDGALSPEDERTLWQRYGLSDCDEWQGEDRTRAPALPDEDEDPLGSRRRTARPATAPRRSSVRGCRRMIVIAVPARDTESAQNNGRAPSQGRIRWVAGPPSPRPSTIAAAGAAGHQPPATRHDLAEPHDRRSEDRARRGGPVESAARRACSVRRVLFDPRGHEPLADAEWDAAKAGAAIREIARDADEALRKGEWWPLHPLDDDGQTPDAIHGVYFGAAGVLWTLDHVAVAGLHEPGHDYARLATEALDGYRRRPEFGAAAPSLFLGESGIALVAWLLAPEPALADRLAELVVVDPEGDTRELLWGSPGLLLIADEMLRRTNERRWAEAWTAIAGYLLRERGERVDHLWTQRLYGNTGEILGAGHGLAGIVAALARRPDLLAPEQVAAGATAALAASAVLEDGIANWPANHGEPLQKQDGTIRTQWCHGAPGIVTSAAALPPDPRLDALLVAGGELTWTAGPLRKGANLCHGTAGNGYALLKLFARTRDELWLHRARRFAMHAAGQVAAARRLYGRGRYSLWTGDLGTAVYLRQCIDATSDMPTLELW